MIRVPGRFLMKSCVLVKRRRLSYGTKSWIPRHDLRHVDPGWSTRVSYKKEWYFRRSWYLEDSAYRTPTSTNNVVNDPIFTRFCYIPLRVLHKLCPSFYSFLTLESFSVFWNVLLHRQSLFTTKFNFTNKMYFIPVTFPYNTNCRLFRIHWNSPLFSSNTTSVLHPTILDLTRLESSFGTV